MIESFVYGSTIEGSMVPVGSPLCSTGAGFKLASAGDVSRSPAIGLLSHYSQQGNFNCQVAASGFLTLNDWTVLTGSSLLTPQQNYYLSTVSGKLTTNPEQPGAIASQLLGVAVSSTTLQVTVSSPKVVASQVLIGTIKASPNPGSGKVLTSNPDGTFTPSFPVAHTGDPVNVMDDFGAKGDGITDDTDAIQAALDSAYLSKRKVFLPYGTYIISRPLILSYHCQMYGQSTPFFATTLRASPSFNTKFNTIEVFSGEIRAGTVYKNDGFTTVVYNGVTYTDGQLFTGVWGPGLSNPVDTFITTGTGKVTTVIPAAVIQSNTWCWDPSGNGAWPFAANGSHFGRVAGNWPAGKIFDLQVDCNGVAGLSGIALHAPDENSEVNNLVITNAGPDGAPGSQLLAGSGIILIGGSYCTIYNCSFWNCKYAGAMKFTLHKQIAFGQPNGGTNIHSNLSSAGIFKCVGISGDQNAPGWMIVEGPYNIQTIGWKYEHPERITDAVLLIDVPNYYVGSGGGANAGGRGSITIDGGTWQLLIQDLTSPDYGEYATCPIQIKHTGTNDPAEWSKPTITITGLASYSQDFLRDDTYDNGAGITLTQSPGPGYSNYDYPYLYCNPRALFVYGDDTNEMSMIATRQFTFKSLSSKNYGYVAFEGHIIMPLIAAAGVLYRKGAMAFITDARKTDEGPGAGTGCPGYYDGTAWRRFSDDAVIST